MSGGDEEAAAAGEGLPPRLRQRVTAVASQGLSQMAAAHIPVVLRKSANFAPTKRAKLVGPQIAALVDADEEFRSHLATQVRALHPGVVQDLEGGGTWADDEEGRITAAAVAYLVRPEGWSEVVTATAQAESRRPGGPSRDLAAKAAKLRAELDASREETASVRGRLRSQLDEVKAQNAALRRTLAQTRQQLRAADERANATEEAAVAARRDLETAGRAAEAEVRRLRARVDYLESQVSSARRAVRDDREAETMRLRLLLDTIMDSANGLRRELALPLTDLLPADTVHAVHPDPQGAVAGVGKSLSSDDPVLLRRLLEVPRVHLIVDGYNVTKSAWESAPLDEQRSRLSRRLAALVAGKGIETTIVFDGADLVHPPTVSSPRGIRVLFSPAGEIADDTIRHLVSAEPVGRPLVVVSTDREVAESITKMGARSVASQALITALGH